jgi:hypothetical protein
VLRVNLQIRKFTRFYLAKPPRAGLTGVRRDEAIPFGLEVARVADYAIRHQTCRRSLCFETF